MRDDHVKMIKNGKAKLVPMTRVEAWIRDGIFEDTGWTFAPGHEEIFRKWQEEETRRRQRAKRKPPVIQRDPGFVDVSRAVGQVADSGGALTTASDPGGDVPDVSDLPTNEEVEAGGAVPPPETIEELEE